MQLGTNVCNLAKAWAARNSSSAGDGADPLGWKTAPNSKCNALKIMLILVHNTKYSFATSKTFHEK